MSQSSSPEPKVPAKQGFYCSIVFKSLILILVILIVAIVPMSYRYYQSSYNYELNVLSARLEFIAERGTSLIDAEAVHSLRLREDKNTAGYREVLAALRRIKRNSGVDNAIIMRRRPNGSYEYVAAAHDGFQIGQDVQLHRIFPATYKATNDTWNKGEMMRSRLFGGKVGDREFDQFLQLNSPLKLNGKVVAILVLNKLANPVAEQVATNTFKLLRFTIILVALGLILFWLISSRMLRLIRNLTSAAEEVSHGNLDVTVPEKRSHDEVGRLATSFEGMIEGLKQRDFIRDTFGRYISKEIVDELLNSPDGLKLGGEVREVTFLVSDLRGFTALSSRLTPNEVIDVVNRFLEPMVDIITRHRGTVDEFQGDGILAFFGAPLAAPDDSARAVACAVEMQRALVELNEEQRARGMPDLHMGIAINTGEVIVGNIGSEKRAKYGAMGTAINMAYRIESYTVSGQVLISADTYQKMAEFVQVGETQDLRFKGLEEPVRVYEVRGMSGPYACEMPEAAPEAFVDLSSPVEVRMFAVEGKTVSDEAVPATIERTSENCMEVDAKSPFERNANLMLRLEEDADVSDVYAKVVEADGNRLVMRFTSLPDDAKAYFERIREAAAQSSA